MTLHALRDDALAATGRGFVLRLGLPWIRSLPLSSLRDLAVSVDGRTVAVRIRVDGRLVAPESLADEDGWWFIQDRLVLEGDEELTAGAHEVVVDFGLLVPYLQTGPDAPLTLPFRIARSLMTDASSPEAAVRERTPREPDDPSDVLPTGWTLAASAFNWTPEVIRSERPATDIAVGIIADGVADVIELEPGQLWRSFPDPSDGEVDALRDALTAAGGEVSIVGASLDDWSSPTRRRGEDERLAFLVPQFRAARRVGAAGVRLPIGQAGAPLLRRLQPVLHDLELVLFEEIQGQQTPDSPATAAAIEAIAELDDPRIRVLVDISMLMPSLPESYLELLRRGGVPESLLSVLGTDWRNPATSDAVIDLLRSGGVAPQVHTAYMNLLVRFGRSQASDLRGILPLVGAFHLKFWDLDDTDGRVSAPIADLGALLAGSGFAGTLCSEWGGHEWIDADPADMTLRHLGLARTALAEGARSSREKANA